MNAHTIAWQMLHAELRRRLRRPERWRCRGPDRRGRRLPEMSVLTFSDPEVDNFVHLYEQARAHGVRELDIMAELAGFAATFAQMARCDPLVVAQQISRSVLAGRREDSEP